ncbi:MAG: lysylphosphatidylglycerol synthase transmembrane domain-containing protein [Bryobacteraceae bacterium]
MRENILQANSAVRQTVLVVVFLAALAGAAWWLYNHPPSFDWALFGRMVASLDWGWVALSAALCLLTYVGRALRWAVLMRPVKPNPSLWNLFKATAIGFTALVLLGRAGEFVRPVLIAAKEGVTVSSQLAAWILERVYDLLIALVFFGFALSQVKRSDAKLGEGLAWALETGGTVAWIASMACLGVLVAFRNIGDKFRKRILEALAFLPPGYLRRVETTLDAFVEGAASTRSLRAVLEVISYTVLEWVLIAGCYICLMRAFPDLHHFSILDILMVMGFIAFGSVVQLPGIGGGVQVVSAVVLREIFGLGWESASGVAMAIWFITFVVVVPIGLPLALQEGLRWSQLRSMGQQVKL